MARRTILIAEPDDAAFTALAKVLASLQINVARAANSQSVLLMLSGKDAIFLDLGDPRMAGGYVLMELAKLPHPPPVVICASHGTQKDAIFALRHGCVDWIDKPYTTKQITAALKRVARRLKREAARIDLEMESRKAKWEVEAKGRLRAEQKADAKAQALAAAMQASERASHRAPKTSRPPAAQNTDLMARVVGRIRRGQASMPVLPNALHDLRRLLRDPETKPARVVALLEADPALSGRIVAHANSSLYGGRSSVRDLRTAVTRLGNHIILEVANTAAVESMFNCKRPEFNTLFKSYWSASIATACLARLLAREAQMKADNQIYLHALLHNVGELYLVSMFSETYNQNTDAHIPIGKIRSKIEEWHPRIGAELIRHWGLEPSYSEIAAKHHDMRAYTPAGPQRFRLLHLINLATRLVESVGASPYPQPVKGPRMADSFNKLRISDSLVETFRERAVSFAESV